MIVCVKCKGKFHRLAMGTRTGSICRWCRESIAHERELKRVRRLPRDVREGKTRPLVGWPAKYAALAEDHARLTKAHDWQRNMAHLHLQRLEKVSQQRDRMRAALARIAESEVFVGAYAGQRMRDALKEELE